MVVILPVVFDLSLCSILCSTSSVSLIVPAILTVVHGTYRKQDVVLLLVIPVILTSITACSTFLP